jgi:acetyl-CoA synthetase
VLHSHQSYPVGHLSTMYWIGLQPGDVHWNISSPGWAKHAWSCFFAPWNAGATVFVYNYARFSAKDRAERHRALQHDLAVRAADRLAHADPGAPGRLEDVPLRELVGAGEPLNPEVIEQVERAWGIRSATASASPRPPRRSAIRRASRSSPARWGGRCRATASRCWMPDDQPADEGEISLALERPLGLMTGYEGDSAKTAEVMRGGFYSTGDTATRDATAITSTSAATTTCSSRRTTASARSNSKAC